jgi:ribonuclease D
MNALAKYKIIDNKKDLQELIPKLLAEPVVAVDTEADSFYHYTEKLCLIQVGIPSEPNFAYLIDPLAMGGPSSLLPLKPVFDSPDVRILFHAGE